MQYFEAAIAGVDDAALLDEPRRGGWADAVFGEIVSRVRQRRDQGLGDAEPGILEHLELVRRELAAPQRPAALGARQAIRLVAMDEAIVELVVAAEMVGM